MFNVRKCRRGIKVLREIKRKRATHALSNFNCRQLLSCALKSLKFSAAIWNCNQLVNQTKGQCGFHTWVGTLNLRGAIKILAELYNSSCLPLGAACLPWQHDAMQSKLELMSKTRSQMVASTRNATWLRITQISNALWIQLETKNLNNSRRFPMKRLRRLRHKSFMDQLNGYTINFSGQHQGISEIIYVY